MKKLLFLTLFGFFGISAGAQDSLGCDLIANFTYTVDGETLFLTNTSTDEPAWAYYDWSVDGLNSTLENPTFPTIDFEESEEVCLTVYDSLEECMDTYCMLIYFEDDSIADSTECELVADFTFVRSEETIFFTNTSTGEPADALYRWYIDWALVSEEENPSFDVSEFEPSKTMCLEVYSEIDWACYDSTCQVIAIDSIIIDSTASLHSDDKFNIEIYPNPVTAVLNVSLSNSNSNHKIVIYNMIGEGVLLERVALNNKQTTINVADLPNGLYIISVIDEANPENSIRTKFIKK